VRAIAAGAHKSCAVTDAGELYTSGRNDSGNLGHGDVEHWTWPRCVGGALRGIRVVGVSIHEKHTLALVADGSVHAFGEGPGLGISQEGEGGREEVVGPTHTPRGIPNLGCTVPR
jgi:alpha-tubulin suppressor-like RCC1 family protein